METELKNFIIQEKIKALKAVVSYYKNGHFPELKETTGSHQWEHLERREKELEEFLSSVNDYKEHQKFELLKISDAEICNYLRFYAIQKRETAQDFPDNYILKWNFLRKAITALNELKARAPQLEIYSNYWLCTRNPIKVN